MKRLISIFCMVSWLFVMYSGLAAESPAGSNAWREKLVFYDPSCDAPWAHPKEAAAFLQPRGFRVVNAEELGKWMQECVDKKQAADTVVVLAQGLAPTSILNIDEINKTFTGGKDNKPLVRRYLEAGGRIVWTGEIPFYYLQGKTGTIHGLDTYFGNVLAAGADSFKMITGVSGASVPLGSPVVTEEGKKWGLTRVYGGKGSVQKSDVSVSLCEFPGNEISVIYFKNYNKDVPYSGFLCSAIDLEHDDLYRLALYRGEPITIPEVTEAPKAALSNQELLISLSARGSDTQRTAFLRDEDALGHITLTNRLKPFSGSLLVEIKDAKGSVAHQDQSTLIFPEGTFLIKEMEIPVRKLQVGDYVVTVSVREDGKTVCAKEEPLFIRYTSQNPFFLGLWVPGTSNALRELMLMDELKEMGVEPVGGAEMADAALRANLRFTQRIEGPAGFPGALPPDSADKDLLMLDSKLKPSPNPWQPAYFDVGLVHPLVRQGRAQGTMDQIKVLKSYPNLYPMIPTNDDFQEYYKMDWSAYSQELFKAITGREAPIPVNDKDGFVEGPKGIIPDNDRWLQWKMFCAADINGAYNQVLKEAKDRVMPGAKIGPVTGMQLPFWYEGTYPPAHYRDFDLLSYYYYLFYWQPLIGNLWWPEVVRMDNRGKLQMVTPDVYTINEPSYYKNTFYLTLAGGVHSLMYYAYNEMAPSGRQVLTDEISKVVKRLGPVIYRLKPATRRVGFLLSVTHQAHDWIHPSIAIYPYANLLAAHIDVEAVCREEILKSDICRYDAILLWNTDWLTESEATALKQYIQRGGVVIQDAGCEAVVEGAKRLDFDLAMGKNKLSQTDPVDARTGRPGLGDYLIPERVKLVEDSILNKFKSPIGVDSPYVVVRTFEAKGVRYAWLVNIHTHEEYEFIRVRTLAGLKVDDPVAAQKEVTEFLKKQGVYDKQMTCKITLPETVVVYDLIKGQQLPVSGNQCSVTMDRLGGTLIGLYPSPLQEIKFILHTKKPEAGKEVLFEARFFDQSGCLMKGLVPISVEVKNGKGEVQPEYSQTYAAESGRYLGTIIPAQSAGKGTWTVTVKELLSNKTAVLTFDMQL